MKVSALVAGLAAGGLQYGLVKFNLFERENVFHYSTDYVKNHFAGKKTKMNAVDERYAAMPNREHEYYTYVREKWNKNVFAVRDWIFEDKPSTN